jgi:hypothetical protein
VTYVAAVPLRLSRDFAEFLRFRAPIPTVYRIRSPLRLLVSPDWGYRVKNGEGFVDGFGIRFQGVSPALKIAIVMRADLGKSPPPASVSYLRFGRNARVGDLVMLETADLLPVRYEGLPGTNPLVPGSGWKRFAVPAMKLTLDGIGKRTLVSVKIDRDNESYDEPPREIELPIDFISFKDAAVELY